MSEKPNVTVIYQDAKPSTPSAGVVLFELVVFIGIVGAVALFAGCGM